MRQRATVGLLCLLLGACFGAEPEKPVPFDSADWKQVAGDFTSSSRSPMVKDVERVLVLGITKDRVRELLGDPDVWESEFEWRYHVAHSIFGPDRRAFEVHFDENDTVKGTEHGQH